MTKDKKPDGEKITVRVSENLHQRYEVRKKPNKSPLHEHHGKPIKWVTCFGFALNPGVERGSRKLDEDGFLAGELEEEYTIHLTKEGDELVHFDGQKISALAYSPSDAKEGDMVQATLKLGDPPIGWT
jgi:hypothetical protein